MTSKIKTKRERVKFASDNVAGACPEVLDAIIKANERLVIVANRQAFETRYPGIEIAGDYSNRLDNSGEWITLVSKDGAIINSFRYNDKSPWPKLSDGEGPSLYITDPSSLPDTSDAANWSASMTGGGNPTHANAINFFGNPTADTDNDGTNAIMEYALGLSDFIPSSNHFPKIEIINIPVNKTKLDNNITIFLIILFILV